LILADSLLGLFSLGISYEAVKISAALKTCDMSDIFKFRLIAFIFFEVCVDKTKNSLFTPNKAV